MRNFTRSLIASVAAFTLAGCASDRLPNIPLIGSLSLPWVAEAPPPVVEPAPVQVAVAPPLSPEPAVRPGKRSRTAAKTRKKTGCASGYRLPNGKCAPRRA